MFSVSFGVESIVNQAELAFVDDNLVLARQLCGQVLQQKADHPRALHLLAAISMQENRPDLAVPLLLRAESLHPESASLQCDLGSAYQELGDTTAAIRHYRLALVLQPDLSMAREKLDSLLATPGQHQPRALPPDPQLVEALHKLATRAAASRNIPQAIRFYGCSLEVDPNQPATLAHMASLYLQTGQERSAIEVLRQALQLGHRTAETYYHLSQALQKRMRLEDALDAARTASQLDPANIEMQWAVTRLLSDIHNRDAVVAKLRQELAANPDSDDLKFKLACVTDDVDLSRFPVSKVVSLFNDYAGYFERHLLERLKYRGHQQLFEAVTALQPRNSMDILDLGCGTGLCGMQFKPLAKSLRGVDIAPAMVTRARARGIYDELENMELVAALSRDVARYDLIVAADVFEYVGDLQATFVAAAKALRAGGLFAFSVEKTDKPGFTFSRETSSFAHSLGYLQELGRQHGFTLASSKECVMRMEERTPLVAWIVVFQKQNVSIQEITEPPASNIQTL